VCCFLERLVWVCGCEILMCVGEFGAGLGEFVCAVCGTVWCGFGGGSVCCARDCFVCVWGSEFVLCVGEFCVGLGE